MNGNHSEADGVISRQSAPERKLASDTALPSAGRLSPAEQTLAQAAAAIDAGAYQRGASLAYEAAAQAVRAAAGRLGMPCATREELKAVVHKLDGFEPDKLLWEQVGDRRDLPDHTGYFIVAESFKEHARIPLDVQKRDTERYWQPEDYAHFIGPVKALIRMIEKGETEDAVL